MNANIMSCNNCLFEDIKKKKKNENVMCIRFNFNKLNDLFYSNWEGIWVFDTTNYWYTNITRGSAYAIWIVNNKDEKPKGKSIVFKVIIIHS